MRLSWQRGGFLVLLAPIVALAANPLEVAELGHGYGLDGIQQQAAEGECGEGKCGEDSGGESEDKTGEGKCGEGKCGD